MDSDTVPYLPQEIITDILLRLPVKSLMRFQCVCKEWKKLFKTPTFIAEHLHHSPKHNSLLFDCTIYGSSLSLLNHKMQVLEFQKPPFIDTPTMGSYRIICSCNGLLCVELIKSETLFLWNPGIREVRQVPKALKLLENKYCCVGFGFTSIVNDYKIVKLFISWYDDLVHRAEVYSLSTGSWKEVDVGNLEGVIDITGSGFTCKGSIFWFGLKEDGEKGSDRNLIVSFDIAMDDFTLIRMPTLSPKSSYCNSLTLHDNKLAMLSTRFNGDTRSCSTDLWVMEGSSWTKICIINPYPSSLHPVAIRRNEIICTTHDRFEGFSKIELVDNLKIKTIVCNLTNKEFKIFAIRRYCYGHDFLISNYVESLVPVNNIHVEEPPDRKFGLLHYICTLFKNFRWT
ncbi:F-box/kelch-repeat protein At3g23880-like [Neltuma alba]|uniref:F-box/kelch-repeat protein At3g23880-like n=1 Tax=Neltuma alba TaxID=207710 RepID=UPI0010A49266|nr:F-box/kelch-repeat protein At3g23880-like [Prosopis alba]